MMKKQTLVETLKKAKKGKLNSKHTSNSKQIEAPVKGNILPEEVQTKEQDLIYFVIDQSIYMYLCELEEGVSSGLIDIKQLLCAMDKEKYIQVAITLFGSTIEKRPFRYGRQLNVNYESYEYEIRLYDALLESCDNMIYQYDQMKKVSKPIGVMLLLTSKGDTASQIQDTGEIRKRLDALAERGISFLIAGFDPNGLSMIAQELGVKPISIQDNIHSRNMVLHAVRKVLKQK